MEKQGWLRRWGLVLTVLMMGTGCAVLKESGMWKTPEILVTGTEITALSLEGAVLEVEVEVFNPNPYGVFVGALDYALNIEGAQVVSGEQNQGVRLEGGQRRKTTLPLRLEFAELAGLVTDMRQKNSVAYTFEGGMRFDVPVAGPLRVPVRMSGDLPIPRLPKVRVAGLKLENISLGGAEMTLHLELENPNAFSLLLERFDYALILNGSSVAEGQMARKGVWEAGSAGEIVLPMRLSFSQTGLALYNLLRRGGEMTYELGFDSEVGTSLPALKSFPFKSDQSGQVILAR